MPTNEIHDTLRDKTESRQRIRKERGRTTVYEYSGGTEVIVEKSAPGNARGLKEVREVTRISTPKVRSHINWKPGQYEKIFGHE